MFRMFWDPCFKYIQLRCMAGMLAITVPRKHVIVRAADGDMPTGVPDVFPFSNKARAVKALRVG